MPLAVVACRQQCRPSTPGDRRVTRACDFPPTRPSVEEIVAVMRAAGDKVHGQRLRGLIVVLWRAGLRLSEA